MVDNTLLTNVISRDRFDRLFGRYGPLIDSMSAAREAKPGQKTLAELDKFRYQDAIGMFQPQQPRRPMTLEDVKVLVDWKLCHGKFRPTLMKLVSSNDEAIVSEIIERAVTAYRTDKDASKALDAISKLRGIGPATASLLLSTHDPDRVIFFSDEVFYWLCCSGQKAPLKYNAKEYRELSAAAQALAKRLNVSVTDIEKVAYVLIRDGSSSQSSDMKPAESNASTLKRKSVNTTADKSDQSFPVLRRSKRGKAA